MATLNIGLKVNRTITGATTVNAGAVALVTYASNTHSLAVNSANGDWNSISSSSASVTPITTGQIVNRIFGPAASVPSSFTTTVPLPFFNGFSWVKTNFTITWTLQSGVELINTQ